MSTPIPSQDKTTLNDLIDEMQTQMNLVGPEDSNYSQMVEQLEKLYKMKNLERSHKVSADTLVAVAGNLLGIGLILNFERAHVVATKALGFVMKAKV